MRKPIFLYIDSWMIQGTKYDLLINKCLDFSRFWEHRFLIDYAICMVFLFKNLFFVEKYAERNNCKVFHCFAQDSYHEHIPGTRVLETYTIENCWPYWDKFTARELHPEPSLAHDGKHYGAEHHERFAQLFLGRFGPKLK